MEVSANGESEEARCKGLSLLGRISSTSARHRCPILRGGASSLFHTDASDKLSAGIRNAANASKNLHQSLADGRSDPRGCRGDLRAGTPGLQRPAAVQ